MVPGLLLIALCAWVWLRFRPSRFIIHPEEIEVIWPLKRRHIAREGISSVRSIGKEELGGKQAGACV